MSTPYTFSQLFASSTTSHIPPRLALSIEGNDKCGKSYWAIMTAPDPIAVITNDPGTLAVVELARRAGKKIHTMPLHFPPPPPSVKRAADINRAEWVEWVTAWDLHRKAMDAIIANKEIRTLVKDTETEVWHLAELSYFGKLQGNQNADVRTKLNADYQQLFWHVYNSRPDLNIILIHKCGKEYKREPQADGTVKADWTGSYERKGYSGIGFLVDAALCIAWDQTKRDFRLWIPEGRAVRYGSPFELIGKSWYAKDEDNPYGFGWIAMEMWPQTQVNPGYWGL
jgi:hypothetical protein